MNSNSLSRELSLISLGLVSDDYDSVEFNLETIQVETILERATESLINHCRQELDDCEAKLELASQNLLESELCDIDNSFFDKIRDELKKSFLNMESVMNKLSDTLEFPRLIPLCDQSQLRVDTKNRVSLIINNMIQIDKEINNVMEGWRFRRLPRIDRDILRLAYIDINYLNIPISVACNEAVNLANKYSDTQGRKMINGILRRLQTVKVK